MLSYEIGIDWGQALSDELPAGPDMQYTPEFAEIVHELRGHIREARAVA